MNQTHLTTILPPISSLLTRLTSTSLVTNPSTLTTASPSLTSIPLMSLSSNASTSSSSSTSTLIQFDLDLVDLLIKLEDPTQRHQLAGEFLCSKSEVEALRAQNENYERDLKRKSKKNYDLRTELSHLRRRNAVMERANRLRQVRARLIKRKQVTLVISLDISFAFTYTYP